MGTREANYRLLVIMIQPLSALGIFIPDLLSSQKEGSGYPKKFEWWNEYFVRSLEREEIFRSSNELPRDSVFSVHRRLKCTKTAVFSLL